MWDYLDSSVRLSAVLSAKPKQRAVRGFAGSVGPWVAGKVRLGLEWLSVAVLLGTLQLPQGAVLYWATSSATALVTVSNGNNSNDYTFPVARLGCGESSLEKLFFALSVYVVDMLPLFLLA